jgi:AICAR transformylase/IMP cyclohydrolase PurH
MEEARVFVFTDSRVPHEIIVIPRATQEFLLIQGVIIAAPGYFPVSDHVVVVSAVI